MSQSTDDIAALAAEANLAPNVHNTQPTRWRLEAEGSVLVLEDTTRRLTVGDPSGRDAAISHGAAIEGFAMASAARGIGVCVEPLERPADHGLRPVARLTLNFNGAAETDELRAFVPVRRTYRGAFVPTGQPSALDSLAAVEDVRLVRTPEGVARLAQLNDAASLGVFRDRAYRAELLSWMRLSRRDPRWSVDGLNAEAMEMSGVVAAAAGVVLRPGIFEALDRIGAVRLFVAEVDVVKSAQAVALFHRPVTEGPLQTGRRFYRLWLEFARLGLSASPMAVLADNEFTRAIIAREFQLPADRRLITTFRLGIAPSRKLSPKPRLPAAALVV
jgi:nitroreductase